MKCTNGCDNEVNALTMADDEGNCIDCWNNKIDEILEM